MPGFPLARGICLGWQACPHAQPGTLAVGYHQLSRGSSTYLGFGTARQKLVLNEGQIPNSCVVRVAFGTGFYRVEGNRRASRNGPVSEPPPEINP
jgi:hypothetical protein